MDNTEADINAVKEAQKQKLIYDLEAKKNSSLSTLNTEEAIARPQYTQQRADKNIASQIDKLNFATFSEKRNQINSGFANTAELSRNNILSRNIGNIDTAENTQMADINRRRSDVNLGYNTDLQSGNMAIETDTASKLLAYREQLRQEKQAQDEQLRREEIDRQNATLAYQRSIAKASATTPTFDENSNREGNGSAGQGQGTPLVKNIGNNTIAVTKPNGEIATFTITNNTPDSTILKWGQQYGIDLSSYIG